jgi:superfamily II DNA or RNA helicase
MAYRSDCIRTISNWTKVTKHHKFESASFDPEVFKKDMMVASPKLVDLINKINELDAQDMQQHKRTFKHFIFSDLKLGGVGAKIIASALTAHGFNLAYNKERKLSPDSKLLETKKKNFILLCSTSIYNNNIGVHLKKELLSKYNQRPDNVYGDLVRFIVMDSGFKEGIDLFDVKYVHIFEPQTSKADQKQVIGRGTRTCGQKGLVFHPTQGWPLHVFVYDTAIPDAIRSKILTPEQHQMNIDSMFKLYMNTKGIDLSLLTFADELEKAVVVASVDYELNKNIHRFELEDDTIYGKDIFSGGVLKPSTKQLNCETRNCGNIRQTKDLPVATPLLTTAALSIGRHIPKFSQRGSLRSFFCDLLKTDPEFCRVVREVNADPVYYIKNHADEIMLAIKKKAYSGLTTSQKSSFLRMIFTVLPRPSVLKAKKMEVDKADTVMNTPMPKQPSPPAPNSTNSTPLSKQPSPPAPNSTNSTPLSKQPSSPAPNSTNSTPLSKQPSPPAPNSTNSTPLSKQPSSPAQSVDFPDIVNDDVQKALESEAPPLILDTTSRNKNFLTIRNHVRENFMQYTWPKVQLENKCGYAGPLEEISPELARGGDSTEIMSLTPTQGFVSSYFTPRNNLKGMLFYHSVGTGKTCSAIATASETFEQEGYTILWVTRTTLKSDIWKNMFDQVCSATIKQKINQGLKVPKDYADRMRMLSKSWSIRPMSYKQFSNLVEEKNSLYNDLVHINGAEDPLRKTLLIIDEAHKLYGGADLSSIERPNMDKLHAALMKSYTKSGKDSVKLLLMTATPMTNDPMELIKLMNLMRLPNEQLSDVYTVFAERFLSPDGTFTKKGKFEFLNEIAGQVSFLNREKDARQFSQPRIHQVVSQMSASADRTDGVDNNTNNLANELDEIVKRLTASVEDEKRKKKEFKDQQQALKDMCKPLKGQEKQVCIEQTSKGVDKLKQELGTELGLLKSEIDDMKDKKKTLKGQISKQKKNMSGAIDQEGVLMTRCRKGQTRAKKVKPE